MRRTADILMQHFQRVCDALAADQRMLSAQQRKLPAENRQAFDKPEKKPPARCAGHPSEQ